jgi:hypothetical protein
VHEDGHGEQGRNFGNATSTGVDAETLMIANSLGQHRRAAPE